MEIAGTKDVRMIEKCLRHPDFVMPEGFESALPAAMAELIVAKHGATRPNGQPNPKAGQYVYRPTARIRATMALLKMLEINEARHAARPAGGDVHVHVAGDVHLAMQRLQAAGLSVDELRKLAEARQIVEKLEERPASEPEPDAE